MQGRATRTARTARHKSKAGQVGDTVATAVDAVTTTATAIVAATAITNASTTTTVRTNLAAILGITTTGRRLGTVEKERERVVFARELQRGPRVLCPSDRPPRTSPDVA